MNFVSLDHPETVSLVYKSLSNKLKKNKYVLWLVSGGSNIPLQVEVMKQIREHDLDHGHLCIMLMDERYGKAGHADSNYYQMQQAGFDAGDAYWVDVLEGSPKLDAVVDKYRLMVKFEFEQADYIIGTFGMGGDGHTAGILPGTPAVYSKDPVVGYNSNEFTRMTLTPEYLTKINEAFLVARGQSKVPALMRLKANRDNLDTLPSILLYNIKRSTVITD